VWILQHDDAFHPDLRKAARFLPRTVPMRALPLLRAFAKLPTRAPERGGVELEHADSVALRLYRPEPSAASGAALLWIHGGGYVLGTAARDDPVCRRFAAEADVLVASVEYRLAPQHPFPAALDDCYAALTWLASRADVDPTRIAIGGASAGAGLAAALSILARERGEVPIAFQLLAYPMLDDRTAARDHSDEGRLRLWNNRSNRLAWHAYTGLEPGQDGVPPLAAPARCDNLSGLPAAWVGVGSLDLFFEEDVAYAERLRAAGVDCELVTVNGAFHGFDYAVGRSGVAREFRASQVHALRASLMM
jgi:acetyl esterase/lipase